MQSPDAFQAALAVGRLLFCAPGRRRRPGSGDGFPGEDLGACQLDTAAPKFALTELKRGPYYSTAKCLGAESLSCVDATCRQCQLDTAAPKFALTELKRGLYYLTAECLGAESLSCVDAACRQFRELNRADGGPWYELGLRAFLGLELEGDGTFGSGAHELLLRSIDWKSRYRRFLDGLPTFLAPFSWGEEPGAEQADALGSRRCRLRPDLLSACRGGGVYLEVEVLTSPYRVDFGVHDFKAGGCDTVRFSPDTGKVTRECKRSGEAKKAYIQPLGKTAPGRGFEGTVGLYLHGGRLAFFRRRALGAGAAGPWESTGFVTDLAWAEGRQPTPYLVAYYKQKMYWARMARVGSRPPVAPERNSVARAEASWRGSDDGRWP